MKILIASDLHGDALRCSELISSFRTEGAERLILLGDILYHGPRNDLPSGYAPKRVIELLNPLAQKIICVRGNCEAEVDGTVLDFDVLTPKKIFEINGLRLILTHGHHLDTVASDSAAAVLYGHTHIPAKERRGSQWFLNPGSTSIPKEKSVYSYMTLDEHTFMWKHLLDGAVFDTLEV